tara:strand:- start:28090 stop:28620 length:531 start_codon:yes stop_codon:yes gene_type:complete
MTIREIPMGECRIDFFNGSGEIIKDDDCDVLRGWMWKLSGPNIESHKVKSVEIPELRYENTGKLFLKVEFNEDWDESYDELPNVKSEYSEISMGDTKIEFYHYNGDKFKIGSDDCVANWMWKISGDWVDKSSLRVRGITIPKLTHETKALKMNIEYELQENTNSSFENRIKGIQNA